MRDERRDERQYDPLPRSDHIRSETRTTNRCGTMLLLKLLSTTVPFTTAWTPSKDEQRSKSEPFSGFNSNNNEDEDEDEEADSNSDRSCGSVKSHAIKSSWVKLATKSCQSSGRRIVSHAVVVVVVVVVCSSPASKLLLRGFLSKKKKKDTPLLNDICLSRLTFWEQHTLVKNPDNLSLYDVYKVRVKSTRRTVFNRTYQGHPVTLPKSKYTMKDVFLKIKADQSRSVRESWEVSSNKNDSRKRSLQNSW